jgi:hypothetical protein
MGGESLQAPPNPANNPSPSSPRDGKVKDYNEGSIRLLFIWSIILAFLFAVGWAPLHGRATIADFFGFVFTSIIMAPVFTMIGLRGVLRGIVHLRARGRAPWGLFVFCAIFLSALAMFGFAAWLLRCA